MLTRRKILPVFQSLAAGYWGGLPHREQLRRRSDLASQRPIYGYVGPGDIIRGASWWGGLRAYNAAYAAAGGKAVTVRRASDNAMMDIGVLASGDLDTASAAAFCSGTTCAVTQIWDQTGNGNHAVSGTSFQQPSPPLPFPLVFNAKGALPAMHGDGYATVLQTAETVSFGNGYPFMSMVAASDGQHLGALLAQRARHARTFSNYSWDNNLRTAHMYLGGSSFLTVPSAPNVWHAASGYCGNNAPSVMNMDGVETQGAPSGAVNGTADTGTQGSILVGTPGGGEHFYGYFTEVGVWASNPTTPALRAALQANQKAYWGTI